MLQIRAASFHETVYQHPPSLFLVPPPRTIYSFNLAPDISRAQSLLSVVTAYPSLALDSSFCDESTNLLTDFPASLLSSSCSVVGLTGTESLMVR